MTGLLDTELTPQQRDFVETIRSSGDALPGLLMTFWTSPKSGKLELEQSCFDLRLCVEGSLSICWLPSSRKDLELAYLFDPHSTRLWGCHSLNSSEFSGSSQIHTGWRSCGFGDSSQTYRQITQTAPHQPNTRSVCSQRHWHWYSPNQMDLLFQYFSQLILPPVDDTAAQA